MGRWAVAGRLELGLPQPSLKGREDSQGTNAWYGEKNRGHHRGGQHSGRRGKAEGSGGGGGTYCGADFPGGEKIRGASVRAEPEVTPANLRPSRAPGAQPHPTPTGKPSPLGTAAPPGAEPRLPAGVSGTRPPSRHEARPRPGPPQLSPGPLHSL
ncbi:WW domain-binding protein 11-like [Panthera leo]|uniref:WW domain-binding protein 11-like n=1 Tax=Panthera leo TaxID=9689 RepID=UPI001C6A369F|nr:WW domain-binding protein 11-like [Panthera leo]